MVRESAVREQLDLLGTNEMIPVRNGENGNAGFADPAFAGNKSRPVHRWAPWIAGFSSEFIKGVLDRYVGRGGIVLDPFCGVGTTLVESLLNGCNSIGFEINPYAALVSRVKVEGHKCGVDELKDGIKRFKEFYLNAISSSQRPLSAPPERFKTRAAFYSPKVLKKVLLVQDFLGLMRDGQVKNIFRVAFASTMVRYSNYSYEPSLGRRVSAGKGEIGDFPVGETIVAKLTEMAEDIIWFRCQAIGVGSKARIINETFLNYKAHLDPGSVDLVVTSPPYLNNYHYNRNTRPQLYWLGCVLSSDDLRALEECNFGKFWQTVRERDRVSLDFALPNSDLEERLEKLRRLNPDKGIYGGNGWANYACAYFNDCHNLAKCVKYALKKGGSALIVLGNSILQGVHIPTDEYMAKIAEAEGLKLVGIEIPRSKRIGNSIIRSNVRAGKAKRSDNLYEAVVELRKI